MEHDRRDIAHVLVVEDEEDHAELLRRAFDPVAERFELSVAYGVDEARARAAESPPDLILTDLNLPDGRGTELLDLDLPLVVMTSHGDEGIAVDAIKSGALDYVVKSPEAFDRMPFVADRAIRAWRNIVERRRAEDELRRSEERLEEAQRVARIGSWEWALDRDTIWGTDEARRIFGISAPRSVRTIDDLLAHVLEADRERMRLAFSAAVEGGSLSKSCRIVRADRAIGVVHITGQLVRDEDGSRRVIGTVQDITERKRLEEEFLQAQKLEAIGLLAGGVAHDINNLLMGIRGCLDVALSRLAEKAPARKYIEEARAATEGGAAVTSQLLMFSRKREEQPAHVQIDSLIADTRQMIRRLLGESIQLTVELATSEARVLCDPGRLQQVLMNLVVNARDAMPAGGALGIATDEVVVDQLPFVRLTVTDTGCGMDDETRTRVFEPFFTTKPIGQGTGLGLSTTYAIVKRTGGHIELDSEIGEGTTFRLLFPQSDGPEADDDEPVPRMAPAPSRATVLVVEDERLVRLAVKHYLEDEGYRVLMADTAASAEQIARAHIDAIDLLLTDVVLPDGSGHEVARSIKQLDPALPCVCMSAYSADILERQYGFDRDVPRLQKPFERSELIAVVREVLATGDDGSGPTRTAAPTVLLIEDNDAARMAAQALLEDLGYSVVEAATGAEARARFADRRGRIDIVLADIGLPDLDGDVLMDELRAQTPDLAVVYMSGRSSDDARVKSLLGRPATAYVQKPVDFDEIARHLESLLAH